MAQNIGVNTVGFQFAHMAFQWHGKPMILKGLRPSHSSLQDADLFFKKPTRKGLFLQIKAQLFTIEPSLPVPELESLFDDFATMFEVSQGLPSSWGHEHIITLKEGTQPMCGRPYRYPYFHKTEIEKIVRELLEVGSIRPSQSPFSSPVLLVRKVDESW